MFKFKGSTLSLLLFLFISLKVSSRSLSKNTDLLDIEVLTPNEFIVRLSSQLKGFTLVNFRVNVNKELSDSGEPDFEKVKADGDVLRFDDDSLNLKKGDIIYYSGLFRDIDAYFGHTGSFIFNGVYKEPDRVKARGVRSAEESSEEESDSDSEETSIENRFGHHHHHDHGRRRGHQHGHGPRHFGPPPFGPPHPPFHHGPGPWNGHGHGHEHEHGHGHGHGHGYNHNFGNNGPWDGHGHDHGYYGDQFGMHHKPSDHNGDHYGDQFGMHHKPSDHKGDHSNENHGFHTNKPEGGGENVNLSNNGLNNNFGDNKPNKATDSGNGNESFGTNNGSNSVNTNGNGSEGNGVEFVSPTKRPTTTETVPNIDIRFPEVTVE